MGLMFAHDHVFLRYQDNYYSGNFPEKVIRRYLGVFDEITFVTRSRDVSEIDNNLSPSNVEGTYFVRVPNFKSIARIHNYFKAKKIIKNEVRKADFIIARTSAIGNLAAKHAKRLNKPYLVEVVSCPWDALWNYSLLGKLYAPFAYFQQRKTVKNAPYVIYVTSKFLQRRYPTSGKHTDVSDVVIQRLNDSIIEKRLEKINKFPSKKIIIGTTAAVNVRYKGQQYVIEALGKLKKRGITHFEYQLVGGGDPAYLINIAQKWGVRDKVKFIGQVSPERVIEWLDNIDIYVQPSRQEGLPRALIEAMSRGLPAIGAHTGGIPELLEDEFIFSNSSRNTSEICDLLTSYTRLNMAEQAKRNFIIAKKYEIDKLEKIRRDFLMEFKDSKKVINN